MSDTPRTDEAELDDAHFSDWGCGPSGYVHADFARQLERENAQLREALEKIQHRALAVSPSSFRDLRRDLFHIESLARAAIAGSKS